MWRSLLQRRAWRRPNVCIKIPTGGGKIFIWANAISRIFAGFPLGKYRAVVWLVPSDAILEQTVRNLSDPSHPYRRRLDADFGGRVAVFTKEQRLGGQGFRPDTVEAILCCDKIPRTAQRKL